MPPDPSRLVQLRRWAVLLDSAFKVPGLPVRFGLDALVGLIPGVGELTTPAFTMLLLFTGLRLRVPVVVLARMALNAGVDALIGLVPVLGDITDVGWKANLRNLELLERHAVPGTPVARGDTWVVAVGIGLIALVALLALVPIVLAAWVIAWVIGQRGLV
jgi:hypothetical protein